MTQAGISKIFVGPYGLHAISLAVLFLFVGFLWIFNFTSFF
jgi:hypothetical protein